MTKLEDSLNGGYAGLYAEVVTHDCYRLRSLDFTPSVIFDMGANVGIFASFAQSLWPSASIVSVEPHPENIAIYKQYTHNTILIEKAIGRGELYHNIGARNGSGEVYISKGLGYPDGGDEASNVPTIMPNTIINKYWKPGMRAVLKMDIEGAENALWDHAPTMRLLRQMDYLAFEIHWYGSTHEQVIEVREKTMEALNSFKKTHDCELDNVHFWARKKSDEDIKKLIKDDVEEGSKIIQQVIESMPKVYPKGKNKTD